MKARCHNLVIIFPHQARHGVQNGLVIVGHVPAAVVWKIVADLNQHRFRQLHPATRCQAEHRHPLFELFSGGAEEAAGLPTGVFP